MSPWDCRETRGGKNRPKVVHAVTMGLYRNPRWQKPKSGACHHGLVNKPAAAKIAQMWCMLSPWACIGTRGDKNQKVVHDTMGL